MDGAPYDFSFSGLKTAVINQIHNASQKGVELPVADLASSFRRAVVDCLSQFQKAAEDLGYTTLVTAGGVSANSLLENVWRLCAGNGDGSFFMPPKDLCGDNAAMGGSQGYYEWKAGNRQD